MRAIIVEFIGTFFLVISVCLTGNPLTVAFVLAGVIYLGYQFSGAHYNPAVTLVVWWKNRMKVKDALSYLSVQLLAAFIASLCAYLISGKPGHLSPNNEIHILKPFFIEVLFTFALVLVILSTAS